MKILGNIKLNQFSKTELEQRAMNALRGGMRCGCDDDCQGLCYSEVDYELSYVALYESWRTTVAAY